MDRTRKSGLSAIDGLSNVLRGKAKTIEILITANYYRMCDIVDKDSDTRGKDRNCG